MLSLLRVNLFLVQELNSFIVWLLFNATRAIFQFVLFMTRTNIQTIDNVGKNNVLGPGWTSEKEIKPLNGLSTTHADKIYCSFNGLLSKSHADKIYISFNGLLSKTHADKIYCSFNGLLHVSKTHADKIYCSFNGLLSKTHADKIYCSFNGLVQRACHSRNTVHSVHGKENFQQFLISNRLLEVVIGSSL